MNWWKYMDKPKKIKTSKYKTRTIKSKKDKDNLKRLKNVMTEDEWVKNFVKETEINKDK